jgi:hypothetical protein
MTAMASSARTPPVTDNSKKRKGAREARLRAGDCESLHMRPPIFILILMNVMR